MIGTRRLRPAALSIAACVVALLPAAAGARDFLYPWKPGTTLQAVSDDQQACMASARTAQGDVDARERQRLRGQGTSPPPADSKAWLAPGLDGQNAFYHGYYDCLRERGYSIRRLPAADYRALRKDGMAVMRLMVADDTPHAEVPGGTIK